MNILYLDTETTGLDPHRHAIIQMAWITEVNGVVTSEYCYDCHPEKADICLDALLVNGYDIGRLMRGKPFSYVSEYLYKSLQGADDWRLCAYNAHFDFDFLMSALKRCGDRSVKNHIDHYRLLDPLALLRFMDYRGMISLENYKLSTVCKHYGIDLIAHDALNDIRATRKLWKIVEKAIGEIRPDEIRPFNSTLAEESSER